MLNVWRRQNTKYISLMNFTLMYVYLRFTEICSLCSKQQYAQFGLDNGLAPIRRQAIIWTDNGLVYWPIHVSLCHSMRWKANIYMTFCETPGDLPHTTGNLLESFVLYNSHLGHWWWLTKTSHELNKVCSLVNPQRRTHSWCQNVSVLYTATVSERYPVT